MYSAKTSCNYFPIKIASFPSSSSITEMCCTETERLCFRFPTLEGWWYLLSVSSKLLLACRSMRFCRVALVSTKYINYNNLRRQLVALSQSANSTVIPRVICSCSVLPSSMDKEGGSCSCGRTAAGAQLSCCDTSSLHAQTKPVPHKPAVPPPTPYF